MDPSDTSIVTFFMVGCQRCGTTWTDAALREHPQIFLPVKKQTYFFDRNYEKGIKWYLENFSGVEPRHIAVGEVATGYCLPDAVPLMARHFPQVKLIMVLRNPVDRAYSNFQTRQVEAGWKSIEQAIETDPDLLERGQYIDQIETLLEHYDRDRILLMLYDDLHKDDRFYLRTILKFIGVDADVESKLFGQRKNAALFPTLRKNLHWLGLKPVIKIISKSSIGDRIRRTQKSRGQSYKPMNSETRQALIEHFQPYNDRLSTFLQRDLSSWNGR